MLMLPLARPLVLLVNSPSPTSFHANLALVSTLSSLAKSSLWTTKIRFDAGSTENSAETVDFLQVNRIGVDPAAPKCQCVLEPGGA